MLNLSLRPEFRGKTLRGTVIELRDSKKGGAIERSAEEFLDITYPSIDLLRTVEALQPDKTKTVVLKGGRGQVSRTCLRRHSIFSATTRPRPSGAIFGLNVLVIP